PASGPGRNDAFGLLSAVLFGAPQPYAPVKYGLVWNLDHRHWVHWDGKHAVAHRTQLARIAWAGCALDWQPWRFGFCSRKTPDRFVRRHSPAALSFCAR